MNALKQALENLNHHIFNSSFKERFRRNPQDFSRNRCLTFPLTILSVLQLAKHSIQIHLNHFFINRRAKPITKQSFSLARQKIAWEAFRALNQEVVYGFYESFNVRLFKGEYLVLAIDGSTFNIPHTQELEGFFHRQKNQASEYLLGKISVLYDVLNKITLDTRIASCKTSEKDMALQHVEWLKEFQKRINKKIIMVFDRGYPALGFFLLLKELGIGFACRAHASIHRKPLKALKENDVEKLLCIESGPKPSQKSRVDTWLKMLPKHENIYKYNVRCIKDKNFILLTNLYKEDGFDESDLKYLYSKRWDIEIHYRSIKVDTLLENFSGKKLLAIFQEIHATILIQNLARIFEYDLSEKKKGLKGRFQPNHREVLGFIKIAISQLYKKGVRVLKRLLTFIKPKWERIKPDRKYPRQISLHRLKNRVGRLCYA